MLIKNFDEGLVFLYINELFKKRQMVRYLVMIMVIFMMQHIYSQEESGIVNMKWEEGSNLLVTLENDSGYVFDINELFHSKSIENDGDNKSYTYYPVVLGESFLDQFKEKNITLDTSDYDSESQNIKYKTLWSGIHSGIGGGWIHFINCILYSLESGQLELTAPLLKRPESKWKPNPVTESYKRTKKWDYYVPVTQKQAIKEYKLKEAEGTLGDIKNIPDDYVQLFLNTNDKTYKEMLGHREVKNLAKIDLIRLLLGANYLGIPQIHYIKSMVLKSILDYSINNPLPSIIIYDDIEAAVAMKLDLYGYHIEKVAFKNEERLSEKELNDKMKLLNSIVSGINEINKRLFEQRLGTFYN